MEIEGAKKLLISDDGKPSPKYQAYLQYARAVAEKERELNEAKLAAGQNLNLLQQWPITGKTYYEELQQAKDQWVVLGHKNEVEQALNVLKATGQDMPSPTRE